MMLIASIISFYTFNFSKMDEHLQEYAIEISILFDIVKYVIDHNRANAEPAIWIQTAQCHDVQTPLVLRCIDATANGAHNDIIVVCKLGQFTCVQNIDVEFVVVGDRKYHCVQFLQLFYVVWSNITQFYARSAKEIIASIWYSIAPIIQMHSFQHWFIYYYYNVQSWVMCPLGPYID